MRVFYHIAEAGVWNAAQADYRPASLETEGFIHCSEPWQVLTVADARFRGRDDLVLLGIDRGRVRAVVKHENTEEGEELFPHVYGSLERDAVVSVEPLERDDEGSLRAPPRLQADLDRLAG